MQQEMQEKFIKVTSNAGCMQQKLFLNQHQKHNNNSKTNMQEQVSKIKSGEELVGGVQDTIYLCNFRVSVDGEWLCLKELQDLDIGQQRISATTSRGVSQECLMQCRKKYKRCSSISSNFIEDNVREPAEIERSNLVNICKLVVKELLEQSLRYGRMLDSDHLPLQHFFIVVEHVLGHGLRPKKGLLGPRKELWDLLQCVENYCPEAQDITASVRDLPTVRTHIGRARAWLRIALMQKKLSDYLQSLIEHREDALLDYYEPHALMMSDEVIVIMGILVGLNVIDCNLFVKEEDLDSQQGVIDFSLYLRSSSRNDSDADPNLDVNTYKQGNMIAVLDQKNYIEELNRHLNATVANLQAKVESLTTTNALMKEDLAIARNSLLALQAEIQALRQNPDNGTTTSLISKSNNSTNNFISDEKALVDAIKSELNMEKNKSKELDKELKLQISLKAESDMAMKLLEKDIHEKQDTIVSLRRQLEDIKQINLEMYRKLQECEDELTQKGEMVSRLQTKASQIGNILQSLEQKYDSKSEHQTQHTENVKSTKSSGTRRQQNLQKFEALTKKHKNDIGPPIKRLYFKDDEMQIFNPYDYKKTQSSITKSKTAVNSMDSKNEDSECVFHKKNIETTP